MQAAQSAWHLLRDRGIDAVVNDSLVGMSELYQVFISMYSRVD